MDLKLLNLGCGTRIHPAWVNIDLHSKSPEVIACDLATGIPFPDETFDVVYHSHVLEHFSKDTAVDLLHECFRVLKPGGIIRICVPDLEQIARAYLVELENAQAGKQHADHNHAWMILELIDQLTRHTSGGEMAKFLKNKKLPNEDFIYRRVGEEARNLRKALLATPRVAQKSTRDMLSRALRTIAKKIIPETYQETLRVGKFRTSGEAHLWMYDRHSLSSLLVSLGFANPTKQEARTSAIVDWDTYHLDALPDGTTIKPDSLFMEAIKPKKK